MNTQCTSTKNLILIAGLLLLAGAFSLKAQSGVWTNTTSGGLWSATGNWLNGTVADGPGNTADFSAINITADNTVHLDASHTLSILLFGDTDTSTAAGWLLDDNGSAGANILTLGTTPTITVNPLGAGKQAAISAVVAGSSGLTKTGAGTLDLSGADTLTGGVTINGGTLTLDYTTGTTTVLGSQALTLGGGTLNILGANPGPSSQTFSGTSLSSGANIISAAPTSGTGYPTLTLGAFSFTASSVQFVGPATTNSSGNVAATATITTTSAGAGHIGLIQSSAGTAYATVGLYDWASTDLAGGTAGTSPYTIIGGSQVSGFYTTISSGTPAANSAMNLDVTGSAGSSGSTTDTGETLRFNTAAAITWSVASAKNYQCLGILVTPNVGANNVNFVTTGSGADALNHNYANPLSIFQNNTLGELIFNTTYYYNILGSGSYIQSGPGTVFLDGTAGNDYSGATYLNGGVTEIAPNNGGGAGGIAGQLGVGTGASLNVNLNGGTLIGDYTGNLDGASSTAHPVVLGNNGGGLGAVTGTTLTVDGVVSDVTGAGPLVIGIPASSANGSTVGQLPGTGTGTANTSVLATGTLILNNTGNTYTGGTVIDSGILQLTVNNLAVLGTAGVTLNGGTFQWNGVTTDISSRTVTLASGGGTLDVNGNTVTLANAIGEGGSGALTVASTAADGALLLNGANTYTGNTTVNSGASFGGTGSLAGTLTLSSGANALMTAGSPMTVSGTVTLNGNTFTTTAAQTTGTYTLLRGGSITGTVNSTPGIGSVAGGYAGVVSISGNSVILTVTSTGTAAIWTDGNADQKWSEAGNWSGGVPHLAGDSATFNSAGGSAVTLNASETVGGITFNNPSSDVISGANTLTLDDSGNGAAITVSAGTANAINTSVALNDNAAIVADSGQSLTLGGTVANSSGSKTLTITGGGTNILSSANTYGPSAGSVGTTLDDATVQVGNNTALGSGDVSVISSSTLQSGAPGLNVANNIAVSSSQTATVNNNGNSLSLSGLISGSGAVAASGAGTLTLSGVNTYGGATAINAGTLVVGGAGQLGSGTYAANITDNGTLTYNSSAAQTLSGVISGTGILNQNGSGALTLSGVNTFTNTAVINAGTLTLGTQNTLANSTLNYSGGSLSFGSLTAATLGGLSGTANLSLVNGSSAAVALTVGGNGASTSYSGSLSGAGSLTKSGAGTLTLSGNESFSGVLTNSGGTLVLSGNNTYTGQTMVTPNATLQLQANAGNVSGGVSSALGATAQLNMGGINGSTSTLQLRSDTSVTFSGGNDMGGLGGTGGGETVTLDVNQLTPAGANNTISLAPAGFNIYKTAFNITGGNGYALSLGSLTSVGGAGTDTFNPTTASLTIAGLTGSSGAVTFALNGSATGNMITGAIADGSSPAYVTENSTGTWTLTAVNTYTGGTTISNGTLVVGGAGQLGSGTYAGSITNTGTFTYNSSAAQTLSGVISGTGALNQNGSGTLTLSGANTYTGNTAINAGIINAGVAEAPGVSGPFGVPATVAGSLSFGGGTLQYSGANNADYSGRFVTSGGQPISIDTSGQTVTFATQIQGAGTTLTKTGNGTLSLAAAAGNTYTGNTTVNGGTLAVNNTSGSATGSGSVTVNSGGLLGGDGAISGAVTVNSGGGLAPGNSVGTNTVGSLTLNAGSINNFEFNSNPANDQTIVTTSGGLVINGSEFNLYTEGTTSPWTAPGTYNLIQYSGALSGSGTSGGSLNSTWTTVSASNPHIANPQPGLFYQFGTSGGWITLTISSSFNTGSWGVDANGNWSVAGNWTALSGSMPPRNAGDSATFGTGTAERTVTLDANETVGNITMNNNNSFVIANSGKTLTLNNNGAGANLYVTGGAANQINTAAALGDNLTATVSSNKSLAISGNIANTSGAKTLTVNGTGTLALSGNNTYGPAAGTVGTVLSGGAILQVGSSTALGAGDVNVATASTLQAGAAGLTVNNNLDLSDNTTINGNGNNFSWGGVIGGTANLVETGNGTLTLLNDNNNNSGNIIVNGGILSIPTYAVIQYTPLIVLNGGEYLGTTANSGVYSNIGLGPTNGSAGGTGTIDAASGQVIPVEGSIDSAGNTGVNNLVINGTAGDNGTVQLDNQVTSGDTYNGTTTISNGWLQVVQSLSLQDSTLNYNNQGGLLVFDPTITAATLGGLTGAQNLGLTNLSSGVINLTVGNNNASTTYSGGLIDAGLGGALTKAGSGTLTLTGTNNYAGATTINGGLLLLNTNGVIDTSAANIAAVSGVGLVVSGGALTATNSSNIGNPSAALRVTSGSATFLGGLSVASADNGAFISVTGGSLTATNLTLGRTGLNDSTQPTAGSTGDGLYINGGAVNILANLNLGTSGGANSSVNTRIDSGSLTVGGAVFIGLNNGARWSVVDVNGGSLTVTDVVTGISIGNAQVGNAELLIRAGTVNAGIIGLGYGTVADTVVLNQTGGSLYLGSGGIVQVSPNATASITLAGGLLGATTNWSCTNNIQLTGANYTIQTADTNGNPQNVYLGGTLSGAGALAKTGAGTLVLSNADTCVGATTISNGTLALVALGSLANTPQIAIASGATFDVSALGSYMFSGASPVQTLAGVSTSGAGAINAGGNTVTLASGAKALFQAAGGATPSVGKISVTGNLALNGNPITINVTGSSLGAGTNRLLDCTGTLSGTANATPVFTGLGLSSGASAAISTTTGSNGHVDLVVTGSSTLVPTQSPHITGFNMVNNNVAINGTNGQTGGTYYLLSSTNLALSLSQWTPVATNLVSTNGANGAFTFIGTNTVGSNGQRYYILSNTNN